jgi:uridine kinase
VTIIGVAGGSGSGKTTFARELAREIAKVLGPSSTLILEQDSYYIDQSQKFDRDGGKVNFDHPAALDWPLLVKQLRDLKSGRHIERPVYDFVTHKRRSETVTVHPVPFVILDGILILVPAEVRAELDYKVFIDTREELRFRRRLQRDVAERGRTPEGVRAQFIAQVKPMHDQFVDPSREFADHVVREEKDFSAEVGRAVAYLLK